MIASSMVQASLSTVMMAVLTTNVFLILLTLCLINKKLLVRAGYRLLTLFVLFTTMRFVLPIELPSAFTLRLPAVFSQIIARCYGRLFLIGEQPISLWQLFKVVWLAGAVIGLTAHIISYYRSSRHIVLYGKELTNTEPYKKLLSTICENKKRKNCFRVIELPGLDVPALFGIIHPRILIPENFVLPEQQLRYILQHEATHHFNHDILLKNLIKVITLAYWWDIFSFLLNRQTDIILEMRIDSSLTGTDASVTQEYMQCLIDMSERVSKKKLLPNSLTIGLLPSGYKDLKHRFQLMTGNQEPPRLRWSVLLISIALCTYLLSYAIICEGYIPPQETVPQILSADEDPMDLYYFPSSNNSYFLDNLDGTYDYYMNGIHIETVESLEYYPEGLPVYTRDNAPE